MGRKLSSWHLHRHLCTIFVVLNKALELSVAVISQTT